MGNQVVVSFLTDWWHEIESHPKQFVQAIGVGMNHGTDSLVTQQLDREHAHRTGRARPQSDAERWAHRHNVTVHHYQHADVPQITYTHQNSSYDVYDFTRGAELGALAAKSNAETWVKIGREMARELRRAAKALDKALTDAEGKMHQLEARLSEA